MEEKTKNILKGAVIFTIVTLGYLGILALMSWMFREGIQNNNIVLLTISGISLVIHSFFIIWLNYEFSFKKSKKKKKKKVTDEQTK